MTTRPTEPTNLRPRGLRQAALQLGKCSAADHARVLATLAARFNVHEDDVIAAHIEATANAALGRWDLTR